MDSFKYRGHEIRLDSVGKFWVSINGINRKFATLKSAQKGIDSSAVIDFQPVEVLLTHAIDWPSKYEIKRVKLVGYTEKRSYGIGHYVLRYFITDEINKRTEKPEEI